MGKLQESYSKPMALRIDGKKLASELESRLHKEIVAGIGVAGRPPGLAVIRIGNDPASGVYVTNKERASARIGVVSYGVHLASNTSKNDVRLKINDLNNDDRVDGILLQLPMPIGLDEGPLLATIDPSKDVDGLHTYNLGRLLKGEPGPRSCTPAGIMASLNKYQIPLEGKNAVVVGRSILVGQPMALMLQAANSTVTVAHSRTTDLSAITRKADILVVAAGKPQMIGPEHVKPGSTVVDVGIHRISNGSNDAEGKTLKLCGDVRFDEVEPLVSAITPVPGGVGPMTVAMLLVNTVARWQEHCGLSLTLGDLLP